MPAVNSLKLIECPRDAMQGWPHYIATETKAAYINALLKVGFDTIDFGSFVSPKAIPQMADTRQVLQMLELDDTKSKLLAIIANQRGAEEAIQFEEINYLGFPFSISETFQLRNTNATILQSLARVEDIQNLCIKANKKLVLYISMAFGNPYADAYNEEIVFSWASKLALMDIRIISLDDTVGLASAAQVKKITEYLVNMLPKTEIGVHLHSSPVNRKEKLEAALQAGCLRFDGAMKGIGGCPMADDELVGNMDTEFIVSYLASQKISMGLNSEALNYCSKMASEIFI